MTAVRGVLFDLYGTLIHPFRRREHEEAIGACAALLGVGAEVCQQGWIASFPERIRGGFATVGDNFAWILRNAGATADPELLSRAEQRYFEFTREGLRQLYPDALATLATLRLAGLSLGLVSNCAPDIVSSWDDSPLADYFDTCAFSCVVGDVKPRPAIYRAALDALGLEPAAALFVGDGSDEEMSGAAAVGLRAVLVRRDLSNTYDPARTDVDGWQGKAIANLAEIVDLR
jgi:putative hydrolase of the HAD superfamily